MSGPMPELAPEVAERVIDLAVAQAESLWRRTVVAHGGEPRRPESEKPVFQAGVTAGVAGLATVLAERGLLLDPDDPRWAEVLDV